MTPEHLHFGDRLRRGATLKASMQTHVTQGIGFIRYIKSFQQPVFSEAQGEAMLGAL